MKKRVLTLVLGLVMVLALCSCDLSSLLGEKPLDMETVKSEINAFDSKDFVQTDKVTKIVRITVRDHGDIIVRLCPGDAPITVRNFQDLVQSGFYDGLIFHRVIRNFMIQGGGYDHNYQARKADTIKGEFEANGVQNGLQHVRGVISMARLGNDMDSASSQFFICDATSGHLDGQYAAFGYVLAGMEVVDSIAAVTTDYNDLPIFPVVIESVVFVEYSPQN